MSKLYPNEYLNSIYEIEYKEIIKKGKNCLIFDIDNTIEPFNIAEPSVKAVRLFTRLAKLGYKICLVSNNNEARVKKFNEKLKLPIVHKAGKPMLSGMKKAMSLIDAQPENTILIGDQVFTDMWVGNRLGLYTILVKPISVKDEFTVKLKRGLEKIVVKRYLKTIQK